MDRSGKELAKLGSHHDQQSVALSPDGSIASVVRLSNGPTGMWLHNFARDSESRLSELRSPLVWSPDGKHVVCSQDDGVYVREVSGGTPGVAVLMSVNSKRPSDWSLDGHFLLYTQLDQAAGADIWYLSDPLKAGAGQPVMFLGTNANETQAQFSRDGHWVAYCSDESGGYEVYVRPFPPGTWQVKVSSSGGSQPRWSPDGKELYYLERTLGYGVKLMATGVRSRQDGTPDIGVPQRLFGFESVSTVPQANTFLYSPAPDGRFLVNVLADPTLPTINLITNWQNLAPGGK